MRSLLVSLLLGFVALNAVLAAAAAAAAFASWYVAIALSVLLALGLVVLSIARQRFSLAWAALIAFAAGVIASMELHDYAALRRSEVVHVASPAEASGEGRSFVFERARVHVAWRAEYRHETARRGNSPGTITWFYAAPLADETWAASAAVPAWAICGDQRCTAGWSKACGAGIPLPERHRDEHRQVVAVAEREYGLRSAPGAPLLACVDSPAAALAAQFEAFRFAVLFWNAAWLAGWLGFGVYRLVRPRVTDSAAPGRWGRRSS